MEFDMLICSDPTLGCLYWYILDSRGMPFIYGRIDFGVGRTDCGDLTHLIQEAVGEELGVWVKQVYAAGNNCWRFSLFERPVFL